MKTNVLVNRPSIHVYSSVYIPYLIIVLILMFFLGVCPTALLCIYSIKLCRRKLNNCCSHRIEIALNTFVDTFQGTFKDGLNGTRDYRISPALFLILLICCTSQGSFGHVFNVNTMLFLGVLLVLTSFLISYARPCKFFVTNLSLSFHMMLSATIGAILAFWMGNMSFRTSTVAMLLAGIALIPHVLMIFWVIHKLLHNIQCFRRTVAVFKTSTAVRQLRERVVGVQQSYESLLPDRLENSRDYRELTTSSSQVK